MKLYNQEIVARFTKEDLDKLKKMEIKTLFIKYTVHREPMEIEIDIKYNMIAGFEVKHYLKFGINEDDFDYDLDIQFNDKLEETATFEHGCEIEQTIADFLREYCKADLKEVKEKVERMKKEINEIANE